MHGRLKVRSTAEQEELKRIEREKKLQGYKGLMKKCLDKLNGQLYDDDGLKYSEDILSINPDVLTLWNLRRKILLNFDKNKTNEELSKYYQHDINLTEIALRKNPKSYGSWLHRQWSLLHADDLKLDVVNWQTELGICNKYLSLDERNFHCWVHRQFVVNHGKIQKADELNYTYEKLCANFSNYSSWHYRSKLIRDLYYEEQIDYDVFKKELTLIENAIFTDPNDQSAWIYQKWLLFEHLNSNIKLIELDNDFTAIKVITARDIENLTITLRYLKLNGVDISKSIKWSNENNVWNGVIINGSNLLDLNEIKQQNQLKVELCLRKIGTLHLIITKNEENKYEYKAKFELKDLRLDSELIDSHLNNLMQLSDLESNKSKWCLLTLVNLMIMFDYDKYKDKIEIYLDSLANEIDIDRKNYYIQLKQKVAMENS